MGKKKNSKPAEKIRLSGRNIYTDKRKRTIYYDFVTKQGYLIEKKNENSALFYKNRFVVILFAAILFGATFLTVLQAVIAGAVMLALAEIAFRRSFLKKLEPVTDVDFEKRVSALEYIVTRKEKSRVIALAVLYLVFAVLVLLNAYQEEYGTGLLIFSACLAIVGVYFSVLHIIALVKINKKEKKKRR